MPKEMIRLTEGPNDVHVGWNRDDSQVQIGVEGNEGFSLFWKLCGPYTEDIGSEVRKTMAEEQPETDTVLGESILNMLDTVVFPYSGIWASLNRSQINQLIKILRRARDSAFGKDE